MQARRMTWAWSQSCNKQSIFDEDMVVVKVHSMKPTVCGGSAFYRLSPLSFFFFATWTLDQQRVGGAWLRSVQLMVEKQHQTEGVTR